MVSPWVGTFWGSPDKPVPDRNSCTSGSSSGGCSKSLGSSAQDPSWQPVAYRICLPLVVVRGACFTSVSLLVLDSSNVTCLLGLMGLGEAAHFFAGILHVIHHWGDLLYLASWQVPPVAPGASSTAQAPLTDHLWLPGHPWETEWLSHLICLSSMAAAASAWWWVSQTLTRAFSHDSCHMFR